MDDQGMNLHPHRGGWVVSVRGEYMGSVKKLKAGWKKEPLGGYSDRPSDRFSRAIDRAAELLDQHAASR